MTITALNIKDALEKLLLDSKEQLGGRLIGTYTYESGLVEPAIAIGNPDNDVDIEGLECILPLVPDTQTEWTATDVYSQETWDIILIQREVPEGQFPVLFPAMDRLRRFFVVSEGAYMPQDDILGSYPQYRLTFKHGDLYPIINLVYQFFN